MKIDNFFEKLGLSGGNDKATFEIVGSVETFEQFCGKLVDSSDLNVENFGFAQKKLLVVDKNLNEVIDLSVFDYVLVVVSKGQNVVFDCKVESLAENLLEIYVEDGASLSLNIVSDSKLSSLVSRSFVQKNGKLEYCFADIGGGKVADNLRFDVKNFLVGEEAECNVNWVYTAESGEMAENFVRNYFQARNCKGQILVKGIQSGASKVDFLGEINISLKGGGTDSYLKQDILLLDDLSKVNAIPSLEIKTNDVKAGHGVSISKITEDKLFYMKSRGIETEVAKNLLKNGFLGSLNDKFSESARLMIEELTKVYE